MQYSKTQWGIVQQKDMRRLQWFGGFISLLVIVVLLRIFSYQVWKRETWNGLAQKQYQRLVKLIAERGIIYDRNMQILAMDAPVFSIAVNPKKIKDIRSASGFLGEVLGGTTDTYRKMITDNPSSSFLWIQKEITEDQKQEFLEKNIPGLIPAQGRKREHPFDQTGIQVLGITDSRHVGVGGIEQSFDEFLRGEDGWAVYQKDGTNRNFVSLDYPVKESRNGDHIVLTLDQVYQSVIEEELKAGVKQHRAKSGCAVLMDPHTGEILSMISVVPNKGGTDDSEFQSMMMNRPVQLDFEPGSTFKIVTAAAALEEHVVKTNSLIHCENGVYRIAGHIIRDHDEAHELLSMRQILEYSSNIGIAKIGKKVGKRELYKTIQNFGFGSRTEIGLPGETTGILWPLYEWSDFSTATISFGQGISTSALQLAGMVSVIANGGILVKPWIVSAILDNEGNIKKTYNMEMIRRVISEDTAAQLRQILEGVILNGNGGEAAVEGVRVAGKTGTAQKSVPGFKGYVPGVYVSSFVGFWPVEAPKYVLVIVLDEPQYLYWGARSSAPIFAKVVRRIEGLPSPYWKQQHRQANNLNGSPFVFASAQSESAEIPIESSHSKSQNISPTQLPELIGLSLREALHRLAVLEVEAAVEGSGIVISQFPGPGTKVTEGMICKLQCQTR